MKRLFGITVLFVLLAPLSAMAMNGADQLGFVVVPQRDHVTDVTPKEAPGDFGAGASTYSMKVVVSMPTGSAGSVVDTSKPANTKLTPCTAGKIDAITVTLTYNAGTAGSTTSPVLDLYMILFYLGADGTATGVSKIYAVSKGDLLTPYTVTSRDTTTLVSTDIYLAAANNPGGSITETFLGGSILLDGAATGTWQLIGIVADNTTVDFNDPTTWKAWDVGTFMIGLPWLGTLANATCQ